MTDFFENVGGKSFALMNIWPMGAVSASCTWSTFKNLVSRGGISLGDSVYVLRMGHDSP